MGDAFQIYYYFCCFCTALGRCSCVETRFIIIIIMLLLLLLVIIIRKAEKYSRNIYMKKAS